MPEDDSSSGEGRLHEDDSDVPRTSRIRTNASEPRSTNAGQTTQRRRNVDASSLLRRQERGVCGRLWRCCCCCCRGGGGDTDSDDESDTEGAGTVGETTLLATGSVITRDRTVSSTPSRRHHLHLSDPMARSRRLDQLVLETLAVIRTMVDT